MAACGLSAAGDLTGVNEADGGEDVNVPRMEDPRKPDSRTKTPDAHTPDAHADDGTAPPKDGGRDSSCTPRASIVDTTPATTQASTPALPPAPPRPTARTPTARPKATYASRRPPADGPSPTSTSRPTARARPATRRAARRSPRRTPTRPCAAARAAGGRPVVRDGERRRRVREHQPVQRGDEHVHGEDGGMCTPTTATFEPFVKATIPGPTGGTCAAAATTTKPATESIPAYVCTATAATNTTGCNDGDVCTATTSARANHCILQSGGPTCPGGTYPSPHPIGTSVTDTRTCTGACTCGGPTGGSCNATWTFYGMGGCTGGSKTVDLDGGCDATALRPRRRATRTPRTSTWQTSRGRPRAARRRRRPCPWETPRSWARACSAAASSESPMP